MGIRHAAAGLLVAGTLAVGAAPAQAAIVPVELVLVIDGSGSISSTNFALQRNAYVNVLGSSLITTDSTMAIGVLQFSSGTQWEYNLTVIDSVATKNQLIAEVAAMTQIGGGTNIEVAINTAQAALAALAFANSQVIDVSTDGFSSGNPLLAAQNAFAAGTITNCLGIGTGANCNFETGFEILVNDFQDFEDALRRKIAQETGQTPEPASMLLFGLGLAGAFAARRRRQ